MCDAPLHSTAGEWPRIENGWLPWEATRSLATVCAPTRYTASLSRTTAECVSVESHANKWSDLHVQIAHELRVRLDELAARLDVVAHECLEDLVGQHRIFHVHLEERARLRIHRRLPELLRVHLAESLVALDVDRVLPVGP